MAQITQKRRQNRCTFCKRSREKAVNEQLGKNEPCESNFCEFITEIANALEQKNKIDIIPKQKKIIPIVEKEILAIPIIEKDKTVINIIKK